jgi:thiamine biosynthesis lipoprotein
VTEPGEPAARVTVVEAERGQAARRFAHPAMATVFEVHCVHPDAAYAAQAAQEAFELLDRLERELSRFLPNSDVSRINALPAGGAARVSPSTMECLLIARRMQAATRGAFDVSLGSGLDQLELAAEELRVEAHAAGVRLDLGGIGKGFAVDRMAEVLAEWDIARALVHGGFSSVLALEPPPGREGWPLSFSVPWPGETAVLARVSGRRRAVSASGTQKGGHILDPRSGQAVRDRAAWVAIGVPDDEPGDEWTELAARSPATLAETLSTAFMILDVEEAAGLCRAHEGLEAWLLRRSPGREAGPAALVHLGGGAGAEAAEGSWNSPPDRR